MISGTKYSLRKGSIEDVDGVKLLLDKHRRELGFVMRPAVIESIHRGEIIVALNIRQRIMGVVHYRHRKDGQTTLYSIVVDPKQTKKGLGRALLDALRSESLILGQKNITLKCPEELPANGFYYACGFTLMTTEPGKHRTLKVWRLQLTESVLSEADPHL